MFDNQHARMRDVEERLWRLPSASGLRHPSALPPISMFTMRIDTLPSAPIVRHVASPYYSMPQRRRYE